MGGAGRGARREDPWWRRGVVYQIYPRSFMDSGDDGAGDLNGIRIRLGYLEWLGVGALRLAPVFPSPLADFAYDVSDHTAVHPAFGTLEDFDAMLEEAHGRGIRVVLDLVPGHTSEEHPWFREARASRESPRRGWYLWRDPAPGGGPPDDERSLFGGSAWELDERTGQYYHHAFLREQPDLNWHNPEVVAAMLDVLRFWLDRGVDGFRVDVPWPALEQAERPAARDVVRAMLGVLDGYGDRVLIGDLDLPLSGPGAGRGVLLPLCSRLAAVPWRAGELLSAVAAGEAPLRAGAWPAWTLGDHDTSRIATRVGEAQARVAAVLLLTLRGTPLLYYGDEIGMEDVAVPPGRVRDPREKHAPAPHPGRDPERTPMQWDGGPGAGFTRGTPWLPLAGDAAHRNVAAQRDDPDSILTLHRRLLALRRAEPALAVGGWRPLGASGDVLAYEREHEGRRFVVALNVAGAPGVLERGDGTGARVVLGTHRDREGERLGRRVELRGDEAVVARVEA